MSTAASIYFSHTHYDIKYVQIRNISTTNVVITYSRVQINRKVANPVQNIPGVRCTTAVHYVRCTENHIKTSMLRPEKWYAVYLKTSILIVERKGLLYMLELVCYW